MYYEYLLLNNLHSIRCHDTDFHRKRKFTAVLENDDNNPPTPKNARRVSIIMIDWFKVKHFFSIQDSDSRDESLIPLILLACMHNMVIMLACLF